MSAETQSAYERRHLTRWFILSPAARESITAYWLEELGPDSLLAARLRQGLVEIVETTSLQLHLESVPRLNAGPVVLIFDRLDTSAYALLDGMPAAALQGLDIRLAEWMTTAQSIIVALNSELLVDEDGVDVEDSADDWEIMPVQLLRAASSSSDESEAHLEARPKGLAHEEIVLSRSRHPLKGTEMLMVEVDPLTRDRYIGREVRVRVGAITYPLGVIQSDGIAYCVVPGPVELASDSATLLLRVTRKPT